MSKYELINKMTEIYLEGGWAFTGLVEYVSPEMIVLSIQNESIILYRNKIVAAKIIEEMIIEESIEPVTPIEYQESAVIPVIDVDAAIETQVNHYGSIIPEDMLEGTPDPTPVSFSISMSDFKKPMEKENKYGPRKKTRNSRKKDTE